MSSSIRQTPSSYTLLHAQCDLLRAKGKFPWAVKLARQAVNCAPSEFVTWEKLTEIYIELGEYESVRACLPTPLLLPILSLIPIRRCSR